MTAAARRIAQFLLSLWDGDRYRADLQAVMYIEEALFESMVELWCFCTGITFSCAP